MPIAVLAAVIGLLKTPYLPLAAMVVFIPRDVFGTMRRKACYVAGTLTAAVAAVLTWSLLVRSRIDMPPLGGTGHLGTVDAQRWIGDHPFGFLRLAVGQFASLDELHRVIATAYFPIHTDALARVPFGQPLIVVCLALLVLIRVLDPRTAGRSRWWRPLAAVTIAASSVALISYGMGLAGLLSPSSLGGFQGRYLYPLVPLAIVWVDPRRCPEAPAVPTSLGTWLLRVDARDLVPGHLEGVSTADVTSQVAAPANWAL